jgi:glycosyltransferase involved in cell wall biosynthesis
MRIVLFDWMIDGHHAVYARRFAEALRSDHDVALALPSSGLREAVPPGVEAHDLGPERPVDRSRARRRVAAAEVHLMRDAVHALSADVLVHLYADPVVRRLAVAPSLGAELAVCLHFPRAHYPAAYGTPLGRRDHAKAIAHEVAVLAWRQRPGSRAVFLWEDVPVGIYNRRRGARAYELPEPPLATVATPADATERAGCVMYGAMRRAKGVDLLAAALTTEPTDVRVVIAGPVTEPGYAPELDAQVASMRAAGVDVQRRGHNHTQEEGLATLAAARCAVLPYARHPGHSRTLVEAAQAGTPVVAHHSGLLGHEVRRHGLGLTVDCFDAGALRRAVLSLAEDRDASARYAEALSGFAARSSVEGFGQAVRAAFAEA